MGYIQSHLAAVLPGAELPEVFRRLGAGVLEELHLDAARRGASDGDVKEHHWVSSRDRLPRFV